MSFKNRLTSKRRRRAERISRKGEQGPKEFLRRTWKPDVKKSKEAADARSPR